MVSEAVSNFGNIYKIVFSASIFLWQLMVFCKKNTFSDAINHGLKSFEE